MDPPHAAMEGDLPNESMGSSFNGVGLRADVILSNRTDLMKDADVAILRNRLGNDVYSHRGFRTSSIVRARWKQGSLSGMGSDAVKIKAGDRPSGLLNGNTMADSTNIQLKQQIGVQSWRLMGSSNTRELGNRGRQLDDKSSEVIFGEPRILLQYSVPLDPKSTYFHGFKTMEMEMPTRAEVIAFLDWFFTKMHGKIEKTTQRFHHGQGGCQTGRREWLKYILKTAGKLRIGCELIMIIGWLDLSSVHLFQKQEEEKVALSVFKMWAGAVGVEFDIDNMQMLAAELIWIYFEKVNDSQWIRKEFCVENQQVNIGQFISNRELLEGTNGKDVNTDWRSAEQWIYNIRPKFVVKFPCCLSKFQILMKKNECQFWNKEAVRHFLEYMLSNLRKKVEKTVR